MTDLLVIAPRWFALTALFSAIGLHLSRLVSRNGSHLIAFGLLALFATVIEQEGVLLRSNFAWLVHVSAMVSSPVMATLREPVSAFQLGSYSAALLSMAAYTVGLFVLAAWLFRHKDLLWVD
jgi:hypothetical protein